MVRTVRSSSRQRSGLNRHVPLVHVQVAPFKLGLQLGAPSVARTIARAEEAARRPKRASPAALSALAVGVEPLGRTVRTSESSASTLPRAGASSGALATAQLAPLPPLPGKSNAP